jgi:hypothetical protein
VLVDLRRYLTLLAEALRSLSDEDEQLVIDHDTRNQWYFDGINRLNTILSTARQNCPENLEMELWDATFTLKHCQYILLSIRDSYSIRERVVDTGALLIKGTLQGYSNQLPDAANTLENLLRAQRSREPWHGVYVELEAVSFKSLIPGFYARTEGVAGRELEERQLSAVRKLNESLQSAIADKTEWQQQPVINIFRGEIRQLVQGAGPYEQDPYYFEYGILDLMYRLSFHLSPNSECLSQMTGAVQSALIWSHKAAKRLHRKATDLYRRVKEICANEENIVCSQQHARTIEKWMDDHTDEVEKEPSSKRYVFWKRRIDWLSRSRRIREEISLFQSEVDKLAEQGLRGNFPPSISNNGRIANDDQHPRLGYRGPVAKL